MNDDRFDTIVRQLATARSRRSALRIFGGTIAGIATTALLASSKARAAKSDEDEYARCGNDRVSVHHDDNNCGGCGNVCPEHAVCSAGICICTSGRTMRLGVRPSSFVCAKPSIMPEEAR